MWSIISVLVTPGELQMIFKELADSGVRIDYIVRRHTPYSYRASGTP
jgi:hypothetical protein